MNELFAGYTNYASTEAIVRERLRGATTAVEGESPITVTIDTTFTVTWTVTVSF
ncbi:hypothetical protein [Streptomyces sp. HPF1205]|uniref:hypothetical protein n=1 Tax=Streptomyces sp. HPF1205 TaxID=2873262 RepID=UPI001CED8570|nr:hypothetical protein [Streptomyces sp. HPF1205]